MHDPIWALSLAEIVILVLLSLISIKYEPKLEARRARREAAEAEARIRAAASQARRAMQEEARLSLDDRDKRDLGK